MAWEVLAGEAGGGLLTSAFNAWQAEKNRDFQRDMSNTAHQREVRDLRRAGLNPILSATKGGPGASTPGGSTAQAASFDFAGKGIQALIARGQMEVQKATANDLNSAASLKKAQETDLWYTQEQRLQLLIAQREQTMSQHHLTQAQKDKIQDEINMLRGQLEKIKVETASSALDLERKETMNKLWSVPNSVMEKGKGMFDKVKPILKHEFGGPAYRNQLKRLKEMERR